MSEGPISSSDPAPRRASWFAGVRALAVAGGVALAAGGLLSCGDSSTEPGPPPPPPPPPPVATTVTVTPPAVELAAIGETVQLSADVRDQSGRAMPGASVAWGSSDVAVVAVDGSGLATAAGNGAATVTATSGSASGTATVTVEQSVTAIVITPDSAVVLVGDTLRLLATPVDALGATVEGAAVAWASGDTLVATVDSSGLATGVATGAVEITATSSDVEGRARLVVAVAAPTTVAVTPDSVSLTALGDTIRLSADVLDQIGRPMPGAAVDWSSGDPAVASVDSTGLVRAEGSGGTSVTASSGSASGSAAVSVMQSASSVTVTPAEASIGPGDTLRLAAKALDANGHPVAGAEFSWSSSDESVATVDGSGLVRGIGEGAVTITATAGDAEGTAELTVANPDRAALVALYEATDGPNWVNSENWLTDAHLGEWYGVGTDHSGRVVSLSLPGRWDADARSSVSHGLSGPIPPEFGGLVKLTHLDLGVNDLTGPVPPELGGLANLTSLFLHENGLSGPIPPELGGLAKLTRLDLRANDLTGPIPPELGSLEKLEYLNLEMNGLSDAIPPELGRLSNLTSLNLGWNDLTGHILPELGSLDKLEWLSLVRNKLTGPIPPELGNLGNLRTLWLGGNELTGSVPPELGGLANLEELDIGATQLEGELPWELLNLRRLKSFGCTSGRGFCVPGVGPFVEWIDGIESFDGSYCNEADMAVLESLHAATGGPDWVNSAGWRGGPALEEWQGVDTDSVGRVTALDLTGNGLVGNLPSSLGLLTELTELRLGNNDALVGRLPLSLTDLSLSTLHYAGTGVCAPPDDSFRTWLRGVPSHDGTGVECAPLSDRDILADFYRSTGGPSWTNRRNWLTDTALGEWHGVEVDDEGRVVGLLLQDNGLSGNIPLELGSIATLRELFLSGNSLSGSIPPELGNLANLRRLILYANELSGPIPPELGKLTNLAYLYLHVNELSGPIPPELGKLSNLRGLTLFWNGLSGPIPPDFGKLTNLSRLLLWNNELSGQIPPELGDLVNLTRLHLGRNSLSGPIPLELGNLANLTDLHLGSNGLTGPIPPELGELADLRWLYLAENALSGPIPPALGGLARLETLSLFNNELSGSLPSELGKLTSLTELDVTNNTAMSGALPASLTNLRGLEALHARGTGLCADGDDLDLWAWLAGVPEVQVASCAPAAAYLVQAVQSRKYPVPLVAGEEALLRVFATAARESDAGMPLVRARLHLDGTETHAIDIPATAVPIPTEIDEGDISRSANAVIPGELVRPGLELVIEVDPEGTLDPALGVAERIPAKGRLAVEVREIPPFDLTVIPFLWASEPDSSVIGIAGEMASDPDGHGLLAAARTLLPVADIEVTAHAPVTSSSNSGFDVLRETEAIRVLEGGSGHHMGLMARFSDVGGVAHVGGRLSASVPGSRVIAHELGHNMNLLHAPCGGAGGPDPRYPYPDGSIGAWGYDFPGEHNVRRGGGPVSPRTDDLMGYCGQDWISDYHFTKALSFRLADEAPPAAAAVRSILVWGGVDEDGVPFLEPSFVVEAPPALPDSVGEHTITGRTTDGTELFSLDFAMPEIGGDRGSSFAFVLPLETGWADALATITLTGPDAEATLDGETNRPMAILRDPASGQVRGFFSELSQDVGTAAAAAAAIDAEPGLRVLFSRGIPDAAAWRR